jgi:hypothetical protein
MDPMFLEWLCAREVCRRCGFSPDEIFFVCYGQGTPTDPRPGIALEIQRGGRTFVWTIGQVDLTANEVPEAFKRASKAWNAGEIGDEEFFASNAFRQAIPFMEALQRKGFAITAPN